MDLLLIPPIASFFVTLFLMPFWIRKAKEINLVWEDINKLKSEKVAGSGGIIVVFGFIIGVLIYVAYRVFILRAHNSFLVETFALLSAILILASIGFIDDLLGWQKGGLRRRHRIILTAIAAIPLVVINAGKSLISLPIIGQLDLGLVYPLVLIPVGIVGAATTFNFLAGFNGLEAGQGIIILSSLAIVSFLTGNSWLSIIALIMIASLIVFLIFNFYPAKVFPGDSLTYSVGGLIAIMAILGNFEKIAVFFFIPYILETVLKIRGKLVKQSFGRPKEDGTLDLRYNKIYSLNHIAIYLLNKTKYKATERKVVILIWIFQLIIVFLGFIIFRGGIFK